MREIGRIAFVQIQRESLKETRGERRYYNPAPLLKVDKLEITQSGARGVSGDEMLVDVHNATHPRSRNNDSNFLSIGFTSHYAAMREKFGDHLTDGIAAENIIVACDDVVTPEITGSTLVIKTQTGEKITLLDVFAAPPCEPFSRFATDNDELSGADMKTTLQFLGNGMRGFYMRFSGEDPVFIQAGDVLYAESL